MQRRNPGLCSGAPVVRRDWELFRTEPRQRVHVPFASWKIGVLLPNRGEEWFDGGRISGNLYVRRVDMHAVRRHVHATSPVRRRMCASRR